MKVRRIKIDNCDSLEIFKRYENKKELSTWHLRFYVNRQYSKSGNYIKSTRTSSQTDAIRIAKEEWHKFFRENIIVKNIDNKFTFHQSAMQYFDLQQMKVEHEVNKDEYFKRSLIEKQFIREKSMYELHVKSEFARYHIDHISSVDLEKFKMKLSIKYQNSTISQYMSLIKSILNYARDIRLIASLPKFPKIDRTNDHSFVPYEDHEIKLITKKLRELSKVKPSSRSSCESYEHYNEVADIVNILYHTPFRPSKEFYILKHQHLQKFTSPKREEFYVIHPPHRKVLAKKDSVVTDQVFKDIYENRICKRYENFKSDDYLFFPNEDRESVRNKVDKIFRKVSDMLNLYRVANSKRNRSLYSVRSSSMIAMSKYKNADLDFIAKQSNSSVNMLNKRYMKRINEIESVSIYDKYFSKK